MFLDSHAHKLAVQRPEMSPSRKNADVQNEAS